MLLQARALKAHHVGDLCVISFIWCHSPSTISIKPVNTFWNLTWSSIFFSQKLQFPITPKVIYPHPAPTSQTDFQSRNPKVVPPLISFSAEEFKRITSICFWRSPLGKGPRRIYCCRNTNIDFIKHCEQRALTLSICPPGPASRLLTELQHLIGEILYPVMLHDVMKRCVEVSHTLRYHQWGNMSEGCLCFLRLLADKVTTR